MTTKQITEEIIKNAIAALQAEGKTISTRALQAHIGYGSLTTIAKYKRNLETPTVSPPNANADELIAKLTTHFLPLIDQRIQQQLQEIKQNPPPPEDSLPPPTTTNQQSRRTLLNYALLQAQLQCTVEELQRKEHELKEVRQLYRSVLADRADKTRTSIALKNKLLKSRAEFVEKEAEILRLQEEIAAHKQSQQNPMQHPDYQALKAWTNELEADNARLRKILNVHNISTNFPLPPDNTTHSPEKIPDTGNNSIVEWMRLWKQEGLL